MFNFILILFSIFNWEFLYQYIMQIYLLTSHLFGIYKTNKKIMLVSHIATVKIFSVALGVIKYSNIKFILYLSGYN